MLPSTATAADAISHAISLAHGMAEMSRRDAAVRPEAYRGPGAETCQRHLLVAGEACRWAHLESGSWTTWRAPSPRRSNVHRHKTWPPWPDRRQPGPAHSLDVSLLRAPAVVDLRADALSLRSWNGGQAAPVPHRAATDLSRCPLTADPASIAALTADAPDHRGT